MGQSTDIGEHCDLAVPRAPSALRTLVDAVQFSSVQPGAGADRVMRIATEAAHENAQRH
jgi:hypothetical protein